MVGLWTVPVVVFIPVLVVRQTEPDEFGQEFVYCIENWDPFVRMTSYNLKHVYGEWKSHLEN